MRKITVVVTYMIYVGDGKEDRDNRGCVTVSAAKIVNTGRTVKLFGENGKLFAEIKLDADVDIRTVGEK